MAIGIPYGGGNGADFLPILKYDARAGRMYRVDRADGASTPVDVTRTFKAVFDFEHMETGWILFSAGGAPSFAMSLFNTGMPARPSADHKSGVRLLVKLAKECGGDIRELAGTSAAFLRGIDQLHDAWLAGRPANPGKLPVVTLTDTVPIESGQGAKKSTNYSPQFAIGAWVARPGDLVYQPRGGATPAQDASPPAPAPATNGAARPPSTGSTPVTPPQPAIAAVAEDDFG